MRMDKKFEIFPNPASRRLLLLPEKVLYQYMKIRISDEQGAIVSESNVDHPEFVELDIRNLKEGKYLIEVLEKKWIKAGFFEKIN